MKTKQLTIVYDPLNTSFSLHPAGGSPTQRHNADTLEYMPDRRITPLVLQPELYVNDPNGITENGYRALVNPRWYGLPSDVAAAVEANRYLEQELSAYLIGTDANYTVGANGCLTVYKNVPYLEPLVLLLVADLWDARTKRPVIIMASVILSTTSTALTPTLELDKPAGWVFDPIHDSGLRKIRANLKLAGLPVSANVRYAPRYWWYYLDGATATLISSDCLLYEGGQDTDTLTIDPRYVNGSIRIRCVADMYLRSGSVPSTPSADALSAETMVSRRYPTYDFEHIVHGTEDVSPDAEQVKNECVVTAGKSVVSNPTDSFLIKWYMRTAAAGSQWRQIGSGETFYLPANYVLQEPLIGLECTERPPKGALCHNGSMLSHDEKPLTI